MARASLLDPPNSRRTVTNTGDGPAMAEVLALAGHGFSSGDALRSQQTLEVLQRTGVTYTGATYGFSLKPEWADSVWDKARMLDGPFARINWHRCQFKEFYLPIYNETQRTSGSRWGGMGGQVGLSETTNWTPYGQGPVLGRISYNMCRFDVFSFPISRDLLADSRLVEPMLDYVSKSEIRFLINAALIGGNSAISNDGANVGSPTGVMNSSATVPVPRAGANAIAAKDIDSMWSGIAGPNKRGACWFASDEVIQTVDQTAQSGGWAESLYFPQGRGGNEFPLLKGRPLLSCENCSALGTAGDLICADFGDYHMYVHEVKPGGSTLSFQITQPVDGGHQGSWGLPEGTVESRKSDQFLFQNDEVVFHWKARMDGNFSWSGKAKNLNGAYVGPASMLV